MNSKSVRMKFSLRFESFEFIDRERCYGTMADSIEALLIERSALLHELSSLNITGEQLGIESTPLNVDKPRIIQEQTDTRYIPTNDHQSYRIKKHLIGYQTQSEGVEHMLDHLKHLRWATEDMKFKCARALLSQRLLHNVAS